MRIAIILMILGILQASANDAYSQKTRLSLNFEETQLVKVLDKIEDESEFFFLYNEKLLDTNRKVSINANDQLISEILDDLFIGTDVKYTIIDRKIILAPDYLTKETDAATIMQQKVVSGTITDATSGEPMAGVNIQVKGTTIGTISDVNGKYSILSVIDQNAILVFSFIGYIQQEAPTAGKSVINIALTSDLTTLEEVVVIGYGTVKRTDLTGSVSSVSSKNLMETASFSATQALQGKASGVVIQQTDATPGAEPRIMIRGNRSLSATNEPLYVVDGIPLSGGLAGISQSSIESIDILKDASATAIYGSRGANGVILVTTKKGSSGNTVIEYNAYYGIQKPAKLVELFDGPEWIELMREAYRTAGLYPATPNLTKDLSMLPLTQENDPKGIAYKVQNAYDPDGSWHPERLESTDWAGAVLRQGQITNHELTVRGGTESIKVYASVNYYDQVGIVKGQDYSRYSFRVNFDWNLTKSITFGGQNLYSHTDRNNGPNLYSQTQSLSPLANIRSQTGDLIGYVGNDGQLWNPVLNIDETIIKNKQDRTLVSYYLEVKLPFDFKFRSNFGLDVRSSLDQSFYGSMSSDRQGALARTTNGGTKSTMLTWENLLYWNKKIQDHTFGLTLLESNQQEISENSNISVQDLPYESQLWYNVGSAPTVSGVSSSFTKWQLASFMGRMNYNYKDRYLLTASARYDGSSRLASGHKWVLFPSAALAWRVSEEDFMKSINVLNNLKFRVGYGITGNAAIDPYKTSGNLALNRYNFGNTNVLGFYQNEMPNPNLSWEKTTQWNAGIDFGILKSRISGVIDVYLQNTNDLLMDRQLPIVSGFSAVTYNIGKTRNKGIEITLNTVNIKKASFEWNSNFTISHNKEEIVELYGGKNDDTGNGWFIGQPLSVYYDYKFLGIWQLGEEVEAAKFGASTKPGTIKILDVDGDYKITATDRQIIGTTRPKFTASLSNYINYKGLDFNFFLNSSFGNMLNYSRDLRFTGRYNCIKTNYWKVTEYDVNGVAIASNESNEAPRPNKGVEAIPYVSSMSYYDASFIRLSNATLGYSFTKKIIDKVGVSKLRIYATIQNAFVITKYPGTDPESGASFGVPNPRTTMFGINMSF